MVLGSSLLELDPSEQSELWLESSELRERENKEYCFRRVCRAAISWEGDGKSFLLLFPKKKKLKRAVVSFREFRLSLAKVVRTLLFKELNPFFSIPISFSMTILT